MFNYTNNGKYLTEDQRTFYEDNGYLIFRKLVDGDILKQCRDRYDELCENGPTPSELFVMKEQSLKHTNARGKYLVKNIQHLLNENVFYKYASCEPLINVVESIVGPNITCIHSMIINKPPNADPDCSKHHVHQDYHYIPIEPVSSIVTTWTATEYTDATNGCLFLYPGTHKKGLLNHQYSQDNKNAGYYKVDDIKDVTPVNIVAEAGDVVFFHPLLLHGSGPNYTQSFRRAILLYYINSDCQFMDVRGTPKEEMETRLLKLYQLSTPKMKNYKDSFRPTAKIIRGKPGKFQLLLSNM